MAKYQIKFNRDSCQSNFVCTAVDPEHFAQADDGLAELTGGETSDNIQTMDIEESELQKAKQAANGCPMQAIEVIDKESGNTLAP